MSAALPPSDRDFEAFRLVKIEQKSTRAAAAELGISQTRICQVIEQVTAFLSEVMLAESGEQREGRLRVARYIAEQRLEHLYGEAYRAWEASKVEAKTVREVHHLPGSPTTTVVAKRVGGDTRFLSMASKLTTHSFKASTAITPASIPRERDCSKLPAKSTEPAPQPQPKCAASDSPVMNYTANPLPERQSELPAHGPVQATSRRELTAEQRQARRQFLGRAS